MKIAVFVAGGGKSGAPRRLSLLAKELSNHFDSVSFVSYKGHPVNEVLEESNVKIRYLWKPHILRSGMRSRGVLGMAGLFFAFPAYLAALFFNVFFFMRPDVVIVRSTLSGLFLFPLYIRKKTKVILDIDFELSNSRLLAVSRFFSLRRSSQVVTQYASVLQEAFSERQRQWVEGKVVNITPGIDMTCIEKREPGLLGSGECKVLHVGSISERKNQLFLLQVLNELKSMGYLQSFRLEFLFVGGVSDEIYYKKLVKYMTENDLANYVSFVGWSDDVSSFMRSSDLMLFPSLNEGVANTLQEAMLVGIPVIASASGGNADVVLNDKTGWVINGLRAREWAVKIFKVIEEKRQAREVSVCAQRYAENNFSSRVYGEKYAGVIKKMLVDNV